MQPVTGILLSEVSPIVLLGHSGEGEKLKHPLPRQLLQTSEESSRRYRYVPKTFFNAHSLKTTYRKQNSSFLAELAEHYKRRLGSGNCSGVQDRVSGIFPPDLRSQHACIRGGEKLNRPGSSLSPTNYYPQCFRAQWSRTEPVQRSLIHCSQKKGVDTDQ